MANYKSKTRKQIVDEAISKWGMEDSRSIEICRLYEANASRFMLTVFALTHNRVD